MPRKGPAPKRPLVADPVYQSPLVTQLVNKILMRGKRSLAETIVYDAMNIIEEKSGAEPIATVKRAVDNVRPQLEVKSRRVGGATYQVPVEVRPSRSTTLGLRWLIQYSRARREKTMTERLMNELLDASNGLGAPDFGSPATNEQFWSDGQHLGNWQLSLGASINLADAPYYDSVAAGLRDNVRRQALVDAAGRGYAIVMAPVYDTASPASAHVVGFVQLKIVGASITASSAPGVFVPYAAAAYGTPSAPSPDVGASVVGLIS